MKRAGVGPKTLILLFSEQMLEIFAIATEGTAFELRREFAPLTLP